MMNVLVIDDDGFSRTLAMLILTQAGHDVRTADCAVQGIALACAQQPDIVLMDVEMERLDGLSATCLLRANPVTAGIRIVALTGHASPSMHAAIADAGCDAHLNKPYSAASLLQMVEAMSAARVCKTHHETGMRGSSSFHPSPSNAAQS